METEAEVVSKSEATSETIPPRVEEALNLLKRVTNQLNESNSQTEVKMGFLVRTTREKSLGELVRGAESRTAVEVKWQGGEWEKSKILVVQATPGREFPPEIKLTACFWVEEGNLEIVLATASEKPKKEPEETAPEEPEETALEETAPEKIETNDRQANGERWAFWERRKGDKFIRVATYSLPLTRVGKGVFSRPIQEANLKTPQGGRIEKWQAKTSPRLKVGEDLEFPFPPATSKWQGLRAFLKRMVGESTNDEEIEGLWLVPREAPEEIDKSRTIGYNKQD